MANAQSDRVRKAIDEWYSSVYYTHKLRIPSPLRDGLADLIIRRLRLEAGLPKNVSAAARAIQSGAAWDGFNGPTGITKDEAIDYAAELAEYVLGGAS